MYSNNGTCHRGRNPYSSLRVSDYTPDKPTPPRPFRLTSDTGVSTSSSKASLRAFPHLETIETSASNGGPLSSHPVTPVAELDSSKAELTGPVPSDADRRPKTSPLDPNIVPDLSLRMPGTNTHSESESLRDGGSGRYGGKLAARLLRLRSRSTSARGSGTNDSKLSLPLPSLGRSRTRSSTENSSALEPAAAAARHATTPLAGTKRAASSAGSLDSQEALGQAGGSDTLGRRARKTSAAMLASARRASTLWISSSQQQAKKQQSQQPVSHRLPEIRPIDTSLNADRLLARVS